jgi:integrase
MARTVRGGALETRAARLRMKPRGKPHFVSTARPGIHLGYRRLEGKNGTWIIRRYQGNAGVYTNKTFAQADDYANSDAARILTYYEAMRRVAGEAPPVRQRESYTVRQAAADYVEWLARHRKTARTTELALAAYVTKYFGDRLLGSLGPADLERWVAWALKHKPAGRLRHGKSRARPADRTVEVPASERERRKRSTLNRVISSLKAALNFAYRHKHVASQEAWIHIQKFRGADAARIHRLTQEQAQRLCSSCDPDFRDLVKAALLTGCRYGELCAVRASDYDATSGTLLIAQSKSGKSRRTPLTNEGKKLFGTLAERRPEGALLLTKSDGSAWGTSEQSRRIKEACKAAKIDPPISFHALRHSYASLLVEAGTPLAFVADALGHSDSRMVAKHYAHLAPNYVHDSIRANLPTFGVDAHVEPAQVIAQAVAASSLCNLASTGSSVSEAQNESDFGHKISAGGLAAESDSVSQQSRTADDL